MSSFLPFYSPLPEATPVYKYIYMYTTLENVYKSLLKNISTTPSLFVYFLPLFFSRLMLLYCDVYIAFSKRSFLSAVSLLSSYIAHFNVLHRSFTLSICSSPLYFYMSVYHAKKKLLRNNCFSFFYFLVEKLYVCRMSVISSFKGQCSVFTRVRYDSLVMPFPMLAAHTESISSHLSCSKG